MLIEADPCGEGQIRANAHKHPPSEPVAEVEAVLDDPPVGELQMPAGSLSNGGHDAGGFARMENGHDLILLGVLKVGSDKVITPSRGCLKNRRTPFLGAVLDPVVKLSSDVAQELTGDTLATPV